MRIFICLLCCCWVVPLFAQKKDNPSYVYTAPVAPTLRENASQEDLQARLIQAERQGNIREIAQLSYEIGIVYDHRTQYPLALKYFLKALQLFEILQDNKKIAACFNSLGIVYQNQNEDNKALAYFEKSLAIKKSIGDKIGTSSTLNNMAIIYRTQKKYDKALEYYEESLRIRKETQEYKLIAASLNNIAVLYEVQGNLALALSYYEESIAIKERINDKIGLVHSLNGLANIYKQKEDYTQSIRYAERALSLARETKSIKEMHKTTEILYQVYRQQHDFENALAYFELYKQLSDSIFNVEKTRKIADLEQKQMADKHQKEMLIAQKKAETERLQSLAEKEFMKRRTENLQNITDKTRLEANRLKVEKKLHEIEAQKQKEEKEFQRIVLYLILAGFAGAVVASLLIFRSNQKTKKAKQALQNTLGVVNAQKKAITDSINYARRIQTAILPPKEDFTKLLSESFVLFQPRDIVSGDFYYLEQKDTKIILAAIDCTGHGVPGALMSMMGKEILDQIIHNQHITQSNLILNELHKSIRKALKQANNENRDGMDLSLVVIDKEKHEIQFSGAKNPLVYIQNNEINHIKGDKKSIGGDQREQERFFSCQIIPIYKENTTMLYLFSDGFQDQFGGKDNKKISLERMKKLFLQVHEQPMPIQQESIKNYFEDWKAQTNTKQMDDVLVIGFRI